VAAYYYLILGIFELHINECRFPWFSVSSFKFLHSWYRYRGNLKEYPTEIFLLNLSLTDKRSINGRDLLSFFFAFVSQ
jgi:hypothetical protein